ncbi:hypothetical protein [Ferrovibrio xuzhouensis]|uniref:Uncharacterized protein n=1 Tax=Ferrovibrio xuzhouensis TaxID=1576914 RepID=A0ABV7VBG8_9PROT
MAMTTPAAALAAVRRPWPKWLRSLILCALGYLAAEYALQQLTFSHDEARTRAVAVMRQACDSDCAARGLRPDDLQGPYEAPVNFLPGSRHFEFLWRARRDGSGLVVMVNDNRLFIDTDHWWEQQDWWSRADAPRP